MFLFKLGVSLLISKLSLISRESLEEAFARTENSSKEGSLSQNSRWSRTALSFEGLHFLKVKGDKPVCSPVEFFPTRNSGFLKVFLKNGYPSGFIDSCFKRL